MGNHRNHGYCHSNRYNWSESMDELTINVRAALKQKWMNNDHNVNLKKMTDFFKTTPNVLKEIIAQYESELLDTKFNIIE